MDPNFKMKSPVKNSGAARGLLGAALAMLFGGGAGLGAMPGPRLEPRRPRNPGKIPEQAALAAKYPRRGRKGDGYDSFYLERARAKRARRAMQPNPSTYAFMNALG